MGMVLSPPTWNPARSGGFIPARAAGWLALALLLGLAHAAPTTPSDNPPANKMDFKDRYSVLTNKFDRVAEAHGGAFSTADYWSIFVQDKARDDFYHPTGLSPKTLDTVMGNIQASFSNHNDDEQLVHLISFVSGLVGDKCHAAEMAKSKMDQANDDMAAKKKTASAALAIAADATAAANKAVNERDTLENKETQIENDQKIAISSGRGPEEVHALQRLLAATAKELAQKQWMVNETLTASKLANDKMMLTDAASKEAEALYERARLDYHLGPAQLQSYVPAPQEHIQTGRDQTEEEKRASIVNDVIVDVLAAVEELGMPQDVAKRQSHQKRTATHCPGKAVREGTCVQNRHKSHPLIPVSTPAAREEEMVQKSTVLSKGAPYTIGPAKPVDDETEPADSSDTKPTTNSTAQLTKSGAHFNLITRVMEGHRKHNHLYVTAWHTGAGLADATLLNKPEEGVYSTLDHNAQLLTIFHNDTKHPAYMQVSYSPYAEWTTVTLNQAVDSPISGGFYFNNTTKDHKKGLKFNPQYPSEPAGNSTGWYACDWAYGVPQLFWITPLQKSPNELISDCSLVELLPELLGA